VRALLAVGLAAVGAWLVLRRRSEDERHVVVAWEDGSELELGLGSPVRDELISLAEGALR
jgi:hypothetical protein